MTSAIAHDGLEERLLELVAFLSSAARLNVDEPSGYGPYRLLEGSVRTVRMMRDMDLSNEVLDAWAERTAVDAMRLIADQPELARRADELVALVASRLSPLKMIEAAGRSPKRTTAGRLTEGRA